jgi:hypothetical protein
VPGLAPRQRRGGQGSKAQGEQDTHHAPDAPATLQFQVAPKWSDGGRAYGDA